MTTDRKKTAILLMAYGTPSNQDDIEPYLTDIIRGRRPTTAEIEDLKRRYREIGGHSPLQEITAAQASKLESVLNSEGIKVPVHFGMKHWHPYIAETAQNFLKSGIHRLIGLVLAPHYSSMSIGGYKNILQSSLANSQIEIDFIDSWSDNPIYHQAVTEKILKALKKFPNDKQVLFTAHSLPERIITEGDPYSSQLLASCEAVAKLSKIEKWSFAYQSAGHTPDKWLGPDILEALESFGNSGNVLIVPIGFVSDHLEILYDIDVEAQTFARTRGINLQRTESLNISPTFIAALADVVRNRIPSN
jgi:ferrochelatase